MPPLAVTKIYAVRRVGDDGINLAADRGEDGVAIAEDEAAGAEGEICLHSRIVANVERRFCFLFSG